VRFSLERAEAWLAGLLDVEKQPELPYARLGLGPIQALLARLGLSTDALAAIHIAGSKGKGSTALLTEAVLGAAGRRVGTFTSPHLERWSERFRIGGCEVKGERLAAAIEQLRPHVDRQRVEEPANVPTFFDALTAAALLLFHEAEVDHAVLEVGLGGRLDSTNAVRPRVTCITTIELEHTDRLGTTLAAIAGEKAGIVKPGVPLLLGALPDEALAVALARAREAGAPVACLGRELEATVLEETPGRQRILLRDGDLRLDAWLPVQGAHQASNAALAFGCARRASGLPDAMLVQAARRGLASAELPARIELVSRAPLIVVDSAHTADSARALARVLDKLPRRRTHFVLSVSAGKDLAKVLDAFLPLASELTLTRAEARRSLDPSEIAAAVRLAAPELPFRVVPNPHLALRAAAEALGPGDCLCVSGSVYLAGIARAALRSPGTLLF
jgi:dihydrofolate synthase/folylpolyglutamate synthase